MWKCSPCPNTQKKLTKKSGDLGDQLLLCRNKSCLKYFLLLWRKPHKYFCTVAAAFGAGITAAVESMVYNSLTNFDCQPTTKTFMPLLKSWKTPCVVSKLIQPLCWVPVVKNFHGSDSFFFSSSFRDLWLGRMPFSWTTLRPARVYWKREWQVYWELTRSNHLLAFNSNSIYGRMPACPHVNQPGKQTRKASG